MRTQRQQSIKDFREGFKRLVIAREDMEAAGKLTPEAEAQSLVVAGLEAQKSGAGSRAIREALALAVMRETNVTRPSIPSFDNPRSDQFSY